MLFAALGWIFLFGQSRDTISLIKLEIRSNPSFHEVVIRDPWLISVGVMIGIAVAINTAWVMLASLFVRSSPFRTTRMWLVFTAIVCGWLGLVVSWPEIYWIGQQQRVKSALPAASSMVEELKRKWPTVDSSLPDIGPFLAYPQNGPTALLPLTEAKFPKTGVRFSAVERTGDSVMRFELAGSESGAWLERRVDGSEPISFVGGLDSEYAMVQAARLSAEWFLVRYRAAGLVERGVRLSPQAR